MCSETGPAAFVLRIFPVSQNLSGPESPYLQNDSNNCAYPGDSGEDCVTYWIRMEMEKMPFSLEPV